MEHFDVVIIGAGPAGACAGAMLSKAGKTVLCVEKQHFPRFSIGESLLPHCMQFLADAGLETALQQQAAAHGFQFKNGAAFLKHDFRTAFDFTDKFSPGPGTTFQVKRAAFDKILADAAAEQGLQIRYGVTVEQVDVSGAAQALLNVSDDNGRQYQLSAGFVLDASGFGRVLPKLLQLEQASDFPVRQASFCHIRDNITDPRFDRNKILITVHSSLADVWFWLIPFSDGTASLGVVGKQQRFDASQSAADNLWQHVQQTPELAQLLAQAEPINEAQSLTGYAANVRTLYGNRFALLGNAGEFLDPVFSSGVTIALRSAAMAVPLVLRQLNGEQPDWETEYSKPLRRGIDTFRIFVTAWYDGRFQDVIFSRQRQAKVTAMISSILAGYAWDQANPYVAEPERRLNVLRELCLDAE
ncbi:MAG: tryptophan 7-halogenase [Gammaproteobacteria bacterium]|nr:tryptophan 7-halogenase [Gammaproteobacteria bacterium]MBU1553576.1 tryptophan 7-halogenase [Gammaproteobacteria bacterium]MBU2070600.1 tryptophan 7-halogenase [Gammaproteobacteria bacterium]MBU2181978.1 tryptophan 7-halogenase [Gammaproteobacteria bacterium]MBU2207106.1 tryptophan 7-halogenase [Gammaproteobacteria bacterium]